MLLNATDLSTLSRLLDEALELASEQRGSWLAGLPDEHEHLLPMLRAMLAEHRAPEHSRFLAAGPNISMSLANSLADPLADTLTAACADAATARAGDLIGPYRLVRELGRGGMACVWLAERPDGVVKRDVALKMPLVTLNSSTQVERFERERDMLALLSHPQIARLYDAGVGPTGQPYIVLEHVQGRPVTDACNAACMDVPARLRVFLQVLAAVDHAHKHLVVHRDIKPSNVFVDDAGQVKLLDFGIAKLLDASPGAQEASALTRDGGCALTPRYAAPEQLGGRPISTATDVYSLGVLLYELLVGQLPHAAAQSSMAQAMEAALHTEPLRPSRVVVDAATSALRGVPQPDKLRALLAGDLDTIVLKALRKEPGERYGSVERFAADVQRFLGHRPIAARAPTLAHGLRLFVRRHRGVVAAGAVGLVSAFALGALLWQQHTLTTAQELRAAAVREFMMDMIEDVNPDEHQTAAEVTGKQMVASGLARAHDRFKNQPVLLGEVLAELGLMLRRLGEDAQARQTLAEALALLERSVRNDDASLNKVRAHMGEWHFADNDLARAGRLAALAIDSCRRQDADCAKARAIAGHTLSEIEARGARSKQAMQHSRQSALDFERGFGTAHAETVSAWGELAVSARNAGDLQEAERAIRKAQSLATNTVMKARDRVVLLRTQAVIELDLGRYTSARTRLHELVARTADPKERALQWRLLGTTELALGQPDAALVAADQALALADPGRPTADTWFAHQAHALAQSLLGRAEAAASEMQAALRALQALGYPPASLPVLRSRRWLAEMMAREGKLDAALKDIEPVTVAMAARGGPLAIELGQALDLQACIQRDRGRLAEAAALHRQAKAVLVQQLPEAHPLLLRNALYQQRVEALASGTAHAKQVFDRLASAYSESFGPTSNWSRVIAAQRGAAACTTPSQRACLLIL